MGYYWRSVQAACLLAAACGAFAADRVSDVWYGHGTAAVLMRSPRLVVAGIDSKETYLQYAGGTIRTEDREVCKAARLGNYYALVAGLDRGSGGYDALDVARAAVQPGDSIGELAARVAASIALRLTSLLSQIRTANPSGFSQRFGGQTVLQLSLLGVEERVPKVVILEFTESEGASFAVSLSLRETRCPGDCANPSTAYFLGVHDDIDDAVRRNPRLSSPPSDKTVGALIDLEKVGRPDIVGGPVAVIRMDQSGVAVVNPGVCAAEVLPGPLARDSATALFGNRARTGRDTRLSLMSASPLPPRVAARALFGNRARPGRDTRLSLMLPSPLPPRVAARALFGNRARPGRDTRLSLMLPSPLPPRVAARAL